MDAYIYFQVLKTWTVAFSRWEGGWEHLESMYCEPPLFTTLPTLAAGPMSPVNNWYCISVYFNGLQFALLIFPGAQTCHLCWQLGCCDCPKRSIFHVPMVHRNPGAEPRKYGQAFKDCHSSHALCFAHWIGWLDENRAADGRTFRSEREFLNPY